MANNAHLFSTDIEDFQLIKEVEMPYYFSRWNLPDLWFLLFGLDSIKFKTVYLEDGDEKEYSWQEIILFEKKEVAISQFIKKLPLLNEIYKEVENDREVLKFIEKIKLWNGANLVLELSEVVEDHPKAMQDFSEAMNFLSIGRINDFMKSLADYTGYRHDLTFSKFKFLRSRIEDSPEGIIGYTRF